MSYTTSPIHNESYFVKLAKELEQMGADSIAIKDMACLLLPEVAYSLVTELKKEISVPIHLHTHNTTGTGDMVNLMASYAGVDIVDCALSPLANGTSQPSTEALVVTLQGTAQDTGLDLAKMAAPAKHFRDVAEKLKEQGGMLSNLISQLHQAGKDDQFYDVLEEIPRVRKEFGYLPLVTPTSQIVGTQAVMNIITCRPADLLEPEFEKYKEEFKDICKSEEDILSCALFPQVAPKFLKWRNDPEHNEPPAPLPSTVTAPQTEMPPGPAENTRMLFVEDLSS